MSERFELSYAYARICGSLARSFLADRAASLATSPRVGEVWRALYGEAPPVLPEAQLADLAEAGLRARPARALRSICGPALDAEPFFSCLLRDGEHSYLKLLLAALAEGADSPPDAGESRLGFDLSAYPGLEGMFGGTRYDWLIELAQETVAQGSPRGVARGSVPEPSLGLGELPAVKNRLDKQYYRELWLSLDSVAALRIGSLRELVRLDAELQNLVWALRLKRYYGFVAEDIAPLLVDLPGADVKSCALDALRRRLESRSDWSDWKWARLLSGGREGEGPGLDVRALESAARRYQCRLLYHRLHLESDTFVPLYAYYRIKELESRAIHGIIEGIKLEAPAAEIGEFALETTGGAA